MRGRPKKLSNADTEAVRKALLKAAGLCLTEKSYHSTSIREIAHRAGTNSAMINYYFGSKQGLVTALLETLLRSKTLQEQLSNLQQIPAEQRARELVIAFLSLSHQYPWLLRLIVDDLVNEYSELRALLVDTVGKESNLLLERFLQLQMDAGYYRSDVDTGLAKLSLLSLLSFPFIASPILKQGYGVDINAVRKGQLVNTIANGFEACLLNTSV